MADLNSELRDILDSYDAFLGAMDMTPADMERFDRMCRAINFGVAAYEAGHGHQAGHAMGRAFMLALIDHNDPQLDYLRADPSSGEVGRLAAADLQTIVDKA